ncbi:unnamed protein product [Fasciola hepatica]|uniref:Uncharacterized protein n=1 Tax=Fasciola hepatica TaxID=6192 RepID=A0ABC9HID9_FASHE
MKTFMIEKTNVVDWQLCYGCFEFQTLSVLNAELFKTDSQLVILTSNILNSAISSRPRFGGTSNNNSMIMEWNTYN